jgi:hypothetical protein
MAWQLRAARIRAAAGLAPRPGRRRRPSKPWKRWRSSGREDPAAYVQRRVTAAKLQAARQRLQHLKARGGNGAAADARSCAPTPRWPGPAASWASRPMRRKAQATLAALAGRTTARHGGGSCGLAGGRLRALSVSRVPRARRCLEAGLLARLHRQRRALRQGRRLRHPGRCARASSSAVEGSHSGIMGLPLRETAELLRPQGTAAPI